MSAHLGRLGLALLATVAALPAQAASTALVRTIDGRTLRGAVTVADERMTVATAEGAVAFALGEVESLVYRDAEVGTIAPAPLRLWLRSGLELPVRSLAGRAAADGKPAMLQVTTPGELRFELPLATVRALRQSGPSLPEPPLFAADLAQPPAAADLLYVVRDGRQQRSTVTVQALRDDRVDFLLRGEPFDFEFAGVAAIVFGADTGLVPDRQPKPRARLAVATGERLDGKLLAIDAERAQLRLDEGAVVDVPLAALRSVQMASDRLAWLGDLQPKVEQTPAFDRVWPIGVDRTPAGKGLVLGGKEHARGVCLVPRARLTYDLGGRFDVFEAIVGIDDRAGPDAHAIVRVLVDGKVAWDGGARTRGQKPEAVRIELKKAQTLALEADFGRNYDLGDFCVFADARLVQQ